MKKVTAKKSLPKAQTGKAVKTKTGMDALKDLGKYVSTFGLATEKYNPAPKKTATKIKKK